MITPELVARINELARKKRDEGLTEAETAEQDSLRRVYLDNIRAQMTQMLDSIKIVNAPSGYEDEGSVTDVEMSHRIMDFQKEMNRPFADTEHIH